MSEVAGKLATICETLKESSLSSYARKVSTMMIQGAEEWEKKVALYQKDLKLQVDTLVDQCRS